MFMKGRVRARVFLYRGVRDIKADEKTWKNTQTRVRGSSSSRSSSSGLETLFTKNASSKRDVFITNRMYYHLERGRESETDWYVRRFRAFFLLFCKISLSLSSLSHRSFRNTHTRTSSSSSSYKISSFLSCSSSTRA